MLRRLGLGFVGLAILISAILLGLAWISPIMSVKTWLFFYREVTIFEAARLLYEDEFLFLAGLVFVFAIVFPALKLLVLWKAWSDTHRDKERSGVEGTLGLFDLLGKWSMLDVFIVAVVVVSMQSNLVSEADIHPGLYLFAGSILISMLAMMGLRGLRERPLTEASAQD